MLVQKRKWRVIQTRRQKENGLNQVCTHVNSNIRITCALEGSGNKSDEGEAPSRKKSQGLYDVLNVPVGDSGRRWKTVGDGGDGGGTVGAQWGTVGDNRGWWETVGDGGSSVECLNAGWVLVVDSGVFL